MNLGKLKPLDSDDAQEVVIPESWLVALSFAQKVNEAFPRTFLGDPNKPDWRIEPDKLILGLIDLYGRHEQLKQSR